MAIYGDQICCYALQMMYEGYRQVFKCGRDVRESMCVVYADKLDRD